MNGKLKRRLYTCYLEEKEMVRNSRTVEPVSPVNNGPQKCGHINGVAVFKGFLTLYTNEGGSRRRTL